MLTIITTSTPKLNSLGRVDNERRPDDILSRGNTMDRLTAMGAFRAVVEEEGFGRAATRIGMSPASVSRIVAELEKHLATRLLHRTTRSLHPTDEGRVYYERCVRILEEVDDAERRLREARDVPRGTLRVTMSPALGSLTIAPLLPAFCARYPEVRVDLNLEPRLVDLVREGFDLGLRLRISEWRDSTLVARHITTFANRFVASPAYLEAHGRPAHPTDLAHHAVIVEAGPGGSAPLTFEGPDGRHVVRVDGPIRTDSSLVARCAVVAGMGIAELPEYVVRDELRDGALVEVFPQHRTPPIELWAVYPPHSTLAARVRAFVDHVIAELR
jgi:DNA-binding transcriptional LysR family regulator